MADNLTIKDGNGVERTVKTAEAGGIHTPIHQALGPLTNTELRADAVKVLVTQMPTTPVPITGAVTGPLTDAQMRLTPVPVWLRQSDVVPVPVLAPSWPVVAGVFSVSSVDRSIVIPGGVTGVRLCLFNSTTGGNALVFYNMNTPPEPVAPDVATNTMGAGNIIWPVGYWKEIYWGPAHVTDFHLMTLAGTATVFLEFLKSV